MVVCDTEFGRNISVRFLCFRLLTASLQSGIIVVSSTALDANTLSRCRRKRAISSSAPALSKCQDPISNSLYRVSELPRLLLTFQSVHATIAALLACLQIAAMPTVILCRSQGHSAEPIPVPFEINHSDLAWVRLVQYRPGEPTVQGDLQKERERGVKPGGTVGRDVSDLKARNITPKLRWTPVARAARARRKASIRLRALFTNRSKEKSEMRNPFLLQNRYHLGDGEERHTIIALC